jgi:hypothetical protein
MVKALGPLAAAVVCLLLAGCSPIVSLAPAPRATAVACAGVVVRLPDRLVNADKRETDAQGTAAWGEPVTVSLRCGVTATPPSSQCVTFEKVDWKVQAVPADRPTRYVLTTYGRTPAVQVVLNAGLPSDQVMPPISDAVAAAIPRATLRCTVQGDATPTPTP